MTVLYRALWTAAHTEDVSQVIHSLKLATEEWAQETDQPVVLDEDPMEIEVSQGRRRRIDFRAAGEHAFEVLVSDEIPGDPSKWTVKIQAVLDDELHVLVENGLESDDLTRRIAVGRPGVVHTLISASTRPHLGHSAILDAAQAIPAAGIDILSEHLADPERTLPVIVCSEPASRGLFDWIRTAERIARRVEGVATVITLDRAAAAAMKERLGSLAIWNGDVRVYTPQPVDADSNGWHHRVYRSSLLETAPQSTIDRIVYSVSQMSARRRVPQVFSIFSNRNTRLAQTQDQVSVADFDAQRHAYEQELEAARDEQGSLQVELSAATGHLARLRTELLNRGLADVIWGTQHEDPTSIPDEVQDISEAVLAAQTYLGAWVVLPESSVRELADLDNSPNGFSWGNTAWRGLRALAAYAQDRAEGWNGGGFWEWCASGPPLGWPATSKKLSMSEGETVQNSAKLSRTRVFSVDERVDKSGLLTMLAHLKIAEGGGPLAPRVYFHDDTGGTTRHIHIGLVGPHYLVPNKSTN